MESTDLARIERSARVAYEIGRLRLALLGMVPVVIIVAFASAFTHRLTSTLWLGVATLAVGAGMLWYGRDPQRAVLPGISAGLVPLVLALGANYVRACGPDGCSTLCVPACALGGAIAGLAVALWGNRRRAGARFWLPASGLALLTGSMGCACVGYSGLAMLGVGFLGGIVPGIARRVLRSQ